MGEILGVHEAGGGGERGPRRGGGAWGEAMPGASCRASPLVAGMRPSAAWRVRRDVVAWPSCADRYGHGHPSLRSLHGPQPMAPI